MDNSALTRSAISAGVFTGIAWFMSGGTHSLSDYAMAAGVQVVASLGSDKVHQLINMYPTKVSSSVVTGGLYTAAEHLRGNRNYVSNYAVSAGSEWSAQTISDMMAKKNMTADAEDAEEGEVF
jgi:hypothetical protein